MAKLELFSLISLGFLIFEIVFIRIGFLFDSPIGILTLVLSFILYCITVTFLFTSIKQQSQRISGYIALFIFIIFIFILSLISIPLANTYDTSWDGQGYHQTAVIALATGWNPMREPSIHLIQKLPSQIFAEGYPSALWEIEASIYALIGQINAAKVVNLFIGIIAGMMIYSLVRKLLFGTVLSLIISFLLVIQPIYTLQLLTFMQDGFGYELVLIAAAALAIITVFPKSYWSIGVFCLAELLLVTTKYSHLPVALILAIIFLLVIGNRFLNREYIFTNTVKLFFLLFIFLSIIFASLPYGRNIISHGALLYSTNITELMGSVRYNNVPSNLSDKDNLSLLFYGIFSKAQSAESGDPKHKTNIAELKVPFTFSQSELQNSAELYNNRVGAGGPLFSGIVILSLVFLIVVSFKTKKRNERYVIYTSYFCLSLILMLSLLAPTPNLLRYVNLLQIIPFAIVIPIYAVFKGAYIKIFTFSILLLVGINTLVYTGAVIQRNILVTNDMNAQFSIMRHAENGQYVKAQHFYSSYLILSEQNIPFIAVDKLRCQDIKHLVSSSTTTQFCIR